MSKTQNGYKVVAKVLEALVENKAHKATAYLSEKFVVNMTARLTNKKFPSDSKNHLEIALTIGKPNYEQAKFVKKCKKAGEPFPVKKIQLKFPKGK